MGEAHIPAKVRLSEDELLTELGLLYNYAHDDSRQFTRWQMVSAISHGYRLRTTLAAVPMTGETK